MGAVRCRDMEEGHVRGAQVGSSGPQVLAQWGALGTRPCSPLSGPGKLEQK